MQFRVTKNLNDPKSSNSGVTTSEENQKECVLPGTTFSNMVKIKLFLADTKSYVSLDLNKIARNTHLFKLTGELSLDNLTLRKNWIWDVLEIRWDDICIILNDKTYIYPQHL